MAADSDAPGAAGSGKRSPGRTLAAAGIAALLAAGVGIGAAIVDPFKFPQPEKGKQDALGVEPVRHGPSSKAMIDLPPIVANLTAPHDVWVRLELSILFGHPVEKPEQLAAQFGTDVLAFLRTLSAEQLEGPAGLLGLRADLSDRAAVRSGGAVSDVAIRTLVVQ